MYNIDVMGRIEIYPPSPSYYHRYRVWQTLGAEKIKEIIDFIEEEIRRNYKELSNEKTMEKGIYRIIERLREHLKLDPRIDSIDLYVQNGTIDGSRNYYIYIGVANNGMYVGYIRFLILTYYPY